jgi:hypothetical protein
VAFEAAEELESLVGEVRFGHGVHANLYRA